MSLATGGSEAAGAAGPGPGGARVFFQSPRGGAGGSPGPGSHRGSGSSREDLAPVATAGAAAVAAAGGPVQHPQPQRRHPQGKVTVKYDRKELRKRLVLEEWIVEQLGGLYGCQVPRRGAGRVGGRGAGGGIGRDPAPGRAPRIPTPPGTREARAFSFQGAVRGPWCSDWDAPAWVQLPGPLTAVLGSVGLGVLLAKRIGFLFSEPGRF